MDKELLLEEALAFFALDRSVSQDQIKERYHVLAKKYHPDSGEFTSPVLFQELQKYYEVLVQAEFAKDQIPNIPYSKPDKQRKDQTFEKYKKAKEWETIAILDYYEKTKYQPLVLKAEENPALMELRKTLLPVIKELEDIVLEKPPSIWVNDARDSLKRLSVWWD